jgi:hypothetical protein
MNKTELKAHLQKLNINVVKGNFVKKSDIKKALAEPKRKKFKPWKLKETSIDLMIKTDKCDAIEIAPVYEETPGNPSRWDDSIPESEICFYSCYLHTPNAGVECISDHETAEEARKYAKELSTKYGLEVLDDTP